MLSPQDSISKVQGPKGTFGKGKPLVKVLGVRDFGWVGFFSSEMHPLAPPAGRVSAFRDLQSHPRPRLSGASPALYGLTTSGPAPTPGGRGWRTNWVRWLASDLNGRKSAGWDTEG